MSRFPESRYDYKRRMTTRFALAVCGAALLAFVAIAVASSGARAQNNFPTAGGSRVDGAVIMCLDAGGLAVPGTSAGTCLGAGGGGGGLSVIDAAAWTAGVSAFTPTGGVFNDSAAALTSGQQGTLRLTNNRAAHVNVRNAAGTEMGTAASPFIVSTNGAATPAGANIIGKFGIDQTTPGTTNAVSLAYLGTTALDGNSGAKSNGTQRMVLATDQPALTNPLLMQLQAVASGGSTPYTPFVPTASDNHQVAKNGAGTSYSVTVSNNSATKNYLRLYDAGTGFNGCNSATGVIFAMEIPPTDSGFTVLTGGVNGLSFSTGLSLCVTSGFGLTDTTNATATAMYVNVAYK